MSDLKQQAIEKSEQIITHPATQKTLASTPIIGGSAAVFEVTQGWLAIISLVVGIIAGLLVIKYNHKRNKLVDMELEEKRLLIESLKKGDSDEA